MIIGIMIVVYFSKENKMITLVSQKENVGAFKGSDLACSADYSKELKLFPACTPKKCGRVVFDNLVTESEVDALLNIAKRGLALGGSSGGASILDLHSGALSKDDAFVNIYKMDGVQRVFNQQDFKIYSHIKDKIHGAIAKYFGVAKTNLYLTYPTFFSRMTSAPPKTIHDEYWHVHVDKETYKSFHYTSLLYLSDYKHEFDGGRFIFVDKEANKTVEPRAGRVSAFTSGSENLHHVEKVTSGTRFAITISFTCDPKHAIKDPVIVNTS